MFARRTLIIFITNIFISIFNLVLFLFIAGKYPSEQFGYLSVANSFYGFILFFGDLNFLEIHVKKMSEKIYNENKYFSLYFIIKIIIIPIVSIIFLLIISFQFSSGKIENNPLQKQILLIMCISAIISSFNTLYTGSFQASMKVAKMQTAIFIGQIIRLIVSFSAIFIFNSFIVYVLSYFFLSLTILIINIFFGRQFHLEKFNKKLIGEYLKFGGPLLIPRIMNVFVANLGVLILLNYYDEKLLGVYYVISKSIIILSLIEKSAKQMLIPTISPLIEQKKINKLKYIIEIYERYMVIISFILIMSSLILGRIFIAILFGDYYAENGYNFLLFSMISTLAWGLLIPYGVTIFASGNVSLTVIGESIKLIFSIISWFWLIPKFQIVGISLGLWISYIPNILIFRISVQKKFKFGIPSKHLLSIISLGIVFSVISYYLDQFIHVNLFFKFLLLICIIGAFISLLFIFKHLTKKDFNFIKDTINPKKAYLYISKELK